MRRRRGLAAGFAAAAVCLAGGLSALPAPAAAATRHARLPDSTLAVPTLLTLHSVRPTAPQPGDTIRVHGTITNESVTAIHDLTMQLYVDPSHISSRSEFQAFATTSPDTPFGTDSPGLVAEPAAVLSLAHPTLPPGGREHWTLALPVDSLGLADAWNVYRLGVAASDTSTGTTVGRLRTFLPYAPLAAPDEQPLALSWVWPLVDQPHRSVVDDSDVFVDDALAPELKAGGRLQRLLQASVYAANQHRTRKPGRPAHTQSRSARRRRQASPPAPRLPLRRVHVTYAVDPMLIEDVQRMAATQTYTVHSPGQPAKPGTGKSDAATWLSDLRTSAGTDQVLALPYADPDITAAVRAGQAQQIQSAFLDGQTTVERTLPPTSLLSGWDWPPDGAVNPASLAMLFDSQISTVVLDGSTLPPTLGPPATDPNAHVEVPTRDGDVTGLLTDSTLSSVVTDGAEHDSGMALQRYLGETLMIQSEVPNLRRSLVVAPAQRWDPTAAYASHLLDDTGRVPWLTPRGLAAAARAPVDPTPRQLIYPHREQQRELSSSYVDQVAGTAGQVDQLAAILRPGTPLVHADDESVLQALSSSWRGQAPAAQTYSTQLAGAIRHTINQVFIAAGARSLITLTSHSGTVPVTVANNLDEPVTVAVRLDGHGHLAIAGNGKVVTIPAQTRLPIDVRATAKTSGQFPVTVRLATPGPVSRPYGNQVVDLLVRSTAYGTVALVITALAFAVLLIAVAVRLGRRIRRARGGAPAHG